MIYYCALSCIGFVLNIWLYVDDIKNRNGILDKVDKKGDDDNSGANMGITDLMTSPTPAARRDLEKQLRESKQLDGDDMEVDMKIKADLLEYKTNQQTRDALKRSVGQQVK